MIKIATMIDLICKQADGVRGQVSASQDFPQLILSTVLSCKVAPLGAAVQPLAKEEEKAN